MRRWRLQQIYQFVVQMELFMSLHKSLMKWIHVQCSLMQFMACFFVHAALVQAHKHTNIHAYMHIHTHSFTNTSRSHTVYDYTCAHVCMHAHTHTWLTHTQHTHTHTHFFTRGRNKFWQKTQTFIGSRALIWNSFAFSKTVLKLSLSVACEHVMTNDAIQSYDALV